MEYGGRRTRSRLWMAVGRKLVDSRLVQLAKKMYSALTQWKLLVMGTQLNTAYESRREASIDC